MTTKQRELNLEYWGRVHDMCDAYNKQHGTNIKPQQCIKVDGGKWNSSKHPVFDIDPSEYSLAVAIIENKPVFVGDKIYTKRTGQEVIIPDRMLLNQQLKWTLTPPKPQRTFELNGQQLPCPSNDEFCDTCLLDVLGEYYYFESVEDRNKVAKAINNLLNNARDKD